MRRSVSASKSRLRRRRSWSASLRVSSTNTTRVGGISCCASMRPGRQAIAPLHRGRDSEAEGTRTGRGGMQFVQSVYQSLLPRTREGVVASNCRTASRRPEPVTLRPPSCAFLDRARRARLMAVPTRVVSCALFTRPLREALSR